MSTSSHTAKTNVQIEIRHGTHPALIKDRVNAAD